MTRPAKTTEQFIIQSKEVHGDHYDYSLVEYKDSKTKVSIICPIHGEFRQFPNHHLNTSGCKVCSYEAKAATAKSEFATKANIIHNSKYDYSLVDYKNNCTSVKILCPQHGEFQQTPNSHLSGNGCALCSKENLGWSRTSFVDKCEKNNNGLGILYILECFNDNEHFYKIGITSRSVKQRYKSKVEMPYAYSVVKEIVGDGAYIYDLETKLHQINKQYKYVPEIPFAGSVGECLKIGITGDHI